MCSAISPCEPGTGDTGTAALLPRADGAAELGLAAAGPQRTTARLAHLYQQSPLRLLFPSPEPGDLFTAVLANTSGGVAGGDRMRVAVTAAAGAAALVTTQAAEKVYRSLGPDSRIETRLTAGPGAWLEWAPQEAILFDGARLRRSLEIEIAPGGRLLAGEMLVYGRTARGERFGRGLLHERWQVRRAGRLIWADALHLDGEIPAVLAAPAGFGGAVASATVLYAGDDAFEHLDAARGFASLCTAEDGGGRAGATLVGGLLVARFLATDGRALRRAVAGYWSRFRAAAAGLPARLPRLWHV